MPLEPFERGGIWWVRGRIEYNGRPITGYVRRSTGALTEAGARDWIAQIEEKERRAHILGAEAVLTFADLVVLYSAKPAEAKKLDKLLDELGPRLVRDISTPMVHDIARKLYPNCATDTWRREVLTPVSAVINHAHQLGKCPPIRIKGFTAQERVDQDARRGKQSRPERRAGSWEWIRAVQPHCNPYVSAALEFMFETGARVGQTVALKPADLDLAKARVWMPAAKGHAAQWVAISPEMVSLLANLPARRPRLGKTARRGPPRVFGYADRTGLTSALRAACKAAEQPYLSPHQAGRHGFYTELRVRQGLDPVTAAKAGRWSNPQLPDRIYAHAETDAAALPAAIRSSDPMSPTSLARARKLRAKSPPKK